MMSRFGSRFPLSCSSSMMISSMPNSFAASQTAMTSDVTNARPSGRHSSEPWCIAFRFAGEMPDAPSMSQRT
jgi:hypothetical protein